MRKGTIARAFAATAAGALLLGFALTPANAAKPRIESTVTIHNAFEPEHSKPVRFFGKVRSSKPACRRKRKVELYSDPGEIMFAGPSGPALVGTTRTDRKGKWQIRLFADGYPRYVVKVKPKKKPRFTCKRARAVYQFVN